MRRTRRTAILFLALAALASAAAANPFYFTGKLGNSTLDDDLRGSLSQIIDGNDTGWGLGLGFRFGRYLAFQAEYQELGNATGAGGPCSEEDLCIALVVPLETDSSAVTVTVLPHLWLTKRLAVYGKLGFVSWQTDVSEISDAADRFIEDFNDQDLVFGAGVRFQLPGPFGVYAEYESIASRFEAVSLGATFGF